jgi:hypothetical protein
MQLMMALCLMAPVVLFDGAEYRAAFAPEQLHALAMLAMQFYILTYKVALAYFAACCFRVRNMPVSGSR